MDVYEPPEREDNVLRGRIVFADGSDLPLSHYRMGREVERFEMDGVRFVNEGENGKLRALVRDMWAGGAFSPGACYSDAVDELEWRTRELGIEVE